MQTRVSLESSERRQKRIAPALAACTVLITLSAGLAACGGEGSNSADSDSAATGRNDEKVVSADGKSSPLLAENGASICEVKENKAISGADWRSGDKLPKYSLVLTQQIELPPQFDALADREEGFSADVGAAFGLEEGLVQYQDRSIGVVQATPELTHAIRYSDPDTEVDIARVNSDGHVESERTYLLAQANDLPAPFDLAKSQVSGYHRIIANDGVEIPAQAMGRYDEQNYAMSVLPDVDGYTVWVLLRGGSDLYKADLYHTLDDEVELNYANCMRFE